MNLDDKNKTMEEENIIITPKWLENAKSILRDDFINDIISSKNLGKKFLESNTVNIFFNFFYKFFKEFQKEINSLVLIAENIKSIFF